MPRTQELTRKTAKSAPAPGLCTSCERQPKCTYAQDGVHPVLQCDEYAPTAHVRARLSEPPPQGAGTSERSLGLCGSCAGRETCTFPRPEGGVWRCEEYE